MTDARALYPVAEKAPERISTPTGKPLTDLTLEAVMSGKIAPEDLAITPQALLLQAEIARSVQRHTLAQNFERAADLVGVPQNVILEIYDMLRPGRAESAQALRERAQMLRRDYGADRIAELIEEAAHFYERRGIFAKRY